MCWQVYCSRNVRHGILYAYYTRSEREGGKGGGVSGGVQGRNGDLKYKMGDDGGESDGDRRVKKATTREAR